VAARESRRGGEKGKRGEDRGGCQRGFAKRGVKCGTLVNASNLRGNSGKGKPGKVSLGNEVAMKRQGVSSK